MTLLESSLLAITAFTARIVEITTRPVIDA